MWMNVFIVSAWICIATMVLPSVVLLKSNDEPLRESVGNEARGWSVAVLGHLRERHPMLRIDICSGGGSRNELETLRRAVPLGEVTMPTRRLEETLSYGMALWIPYFGTGINTTDPYTFWSQLAPANTTTWDEAR